MSGYSPADERVFNFLRTSATYVAIVGSRYLPSSEKQRIASLIGQLPQGCTVVTGGAPGVDTWAESLANERGLRCAVVRPSRGGLHMATDYLGRTVIVNGAQVVVAFWDGTSAGTLDSIDKAIAHHGLCVVVVPNAAPEVRWDEFVPCADHWSVAGWARRG